jgi:hypothetical protein
MATINLTLTVTPDAKANELLDAFCVAHGFQSGAGLTKLQFLRREVIEFLRAPYVAQKRRTLDQASAEAIRLDLDAISIS